TGFDQPYRDLEVAPATAGGSALPVARTGRKDITVSKPPLRQLRRHRPHVHTGLEVARLDAAGVKALGADRLDGPALARLGHGPPARGTARLRKPQRPNGGKPGLVHVGSNTGDEL